MSPAPGDRLGGYEILSLVGAGGMGEVYRARDTNLKRDVAVKILPDAFASDLERLARFQREAEVLATLNHPNIAQIHGLEERALVLELVDGPTLADRTVGDDHKGLRFQGPAEAGHHGSVSTAAFSSHWLVATPCGGGSVCSQASSYSNESRAPATRRAGVRVTAWQQHGPPDASAELDSRAAEAAPYRGAAEAIPYRRHACC